MSEKERKNDGDEDGVYHKNAAIVFPLQICITRPFYFENKTEIPIAEGSESKQMH